MQTLKNIHKEYLKKLAVGITNKACVSECKCGSDDSTEKKKCLFRKTLNGSDKVLVDVWFELIDAVSEVIYTKCVDDMAHPDLVREGLHLAAVRNVIILVGSNECTASMLLRLITDFNAH